MARKATLELERSRERENAEAALWATSEKNVEPGGETVILNREMSKSFSEIPSQEQASKPTAKTEGGIRTKSAKADSAPAESGKK